MPKYLTSATLNSWVSVWLYWDLVQRQQTVSQWMLRFALACAFITMTGLLGPSPIAEAASCGANNQRPCNIFERIPSCNKGLYEDFKKGRCLSKAVPGRDCGPVNKRPCKVWERIPSCNAGLVEDFKKGLCVTKAIPGKDCGKLNQRACKVWERVPSCNTGLVEDLKRGWCVAKAVPGKDCGNANQRPCTIVERIPSCNKGLVEHFPTNRCTSLADLGKKYKCGMRNQKPCKVLERIPSCDDNLKEDFAKGICVAVPCGSKFGRPCTVVERIPSCDSGLVEDFLKGKCVPSEDAERHRIAEQKLQQIGEFVLSKVGFATNVADNPQVRNNLNGQDKTAVARVVNPTEVGETQMPDGHLLRTLTIGASGGVKIFIGASGGAGASIDLKGKRPAYAYATGDYSLSLGVAAGGGVDVGFWVCQNNKIGGDSWGVEFGVDDIALALAKKVSPKGGPSLGIGLWFNYSKPPVFQGFTISPGFGIGVDFGGVVKAGTAVEDDPSVECDGRPKAVSSRRPNAAVPQLGSKLGPKQPHSKSGSKRLTKTFIQDINYGGGIIRQQKVSKEGLRPGLVRICLTNLTGQPKAITHGVSGINPLTAPTYKSGSCANFSAKLRLHISFVDRGGIKKRDAMSLSQYAGDIVVFEWLRDH